MKIERHLRYKLEMEPEEYELLSSGLVALSLAGLNKIPHESVYNLIKQMSRGRNECVYE